jgi:hypothetical protein
LNFDSARDNKQAKNRHQKFNIIYKEEIRKTIPWTGVTIQQFLTIDYYCIQTVHDLYGSDIQGVDAVRLYHNGSVYFLDMDMGCGNDKELNTSLNKLEVDENGVDVSTGRTNKNVQPYPTMMTCPQAKENLSSSLALLRHYNIKIVQRWAHVAVIGVQSYRKGDVSF